MSNLSPTMHLAEALAYLVEREQTIDEAERKSEADRDETLQRRNDNLRAIEGVEQAISTLPAEALPEAAIQVMIAAGLARALTDGFEEDPAKREALSTIDRLLHSALAALGGLGGVDLERYNPARYGLRWAPPEPVATVMSG